MTHPLIQAIEKDYLKTDLPDVFTGDTVKVMVLIKEGNKERTQAFEGVVIRKSGSGTSATVTVRRVFQGIGVERIFLLHSPKVADIKILRRGDVRRSRIYYMRGRSGKAARIREKVGAVLNTGEKVKKKSRKALKIEAAKAAAANPAPAAEAKPVEAPKKAAETSAPVTEENS